MKRLKIETVFNFNLRNIMRLRKLNSNNVSNYIGYNILFKSHGQIIFKQILRASDTGKTIYIEPTAPYFYNSLETVHRNIYIILPE